MSDDADFAEEKIEAAIADGIAHVRYMMQKSSISPCNACHFCGEWVKAGVLFCSRDCASDWQYQQDRKKAQGR